jgi:hypothetical protein
MIFPEGERSCLTPMVQHFPGGYDLWIRACQRLGQSDEGKNCIASWLLYTSQLYEPFIELVRHIILHAPHSPLPTLPPHAPLPRLLTSDPGSRH